MQSSVPSRWQTLTLVLSHASYSRSSLPSHPALFRACGFFDTPVTARARMQQRGAYSSCMLVECGT